MLLVGVEVLEEGWGRNDGEFVIVREEGVLIAVVVGVDNGKMPVVVSTRVTPTRMVAPAWLMALTLCLVKMTVR